MKTCGCFAMGFMLFSMIAQAADLGNRLTYLDSPVDPYYVGLDAARLTTPQWIGEDGVQAVIVLAIDDMTDADKYESYLRPILERLKQIDGRAPVSIMTKQIDTTLPRLQSWAEEGVTVEAHTQDHPCPCLQKDSFEAAKSTYDRCVDQLHSLPNGPPVAFRMPCCDSMNSVSPRFFAEIFNKTTPQGHFLNMDSSVFMLFTPADSTLPNKVVYDRDGNERFRRYVPTDRTMVNFVENYPYPYVIGHRCWEFPSLMPSDWVAQHLQGVCNPRTVVDFKAAVDAVVVKQGVFSLCFHPHGWIDSSQVVELIDYAAKRYGGRVKFLNFREVHERLTENLLGGQPLRTKTGGDNGVRILDADADGLMDVVIGNPDHRETRIWDESRRRWRSVGFPVSLVNDDSRPCSEERGVRFGVLRTDGHASLIVQNEDSGAVWHFDQDDWTEDARGLQGLDLDTVFATQLNGVDRGVRLRDLDLDGICELIVSNEDHNAIFGLRRNGWRRLRATLPEGVSIVDRRGRDAGLRFVDLDLEGHDDLVFSNSKRFSVHLWSSLEEGWSQTTLASTRSDTTALPMIVRADGSNNGVWFSHRHMWLQNEETGANLPDHVDRRSFAQLLGTLEER